MRHRIWLRGRVSQTEFLKTLGAGIAVLALSAAGTLRVAPTTPPTPETPPAEISTAEPAAPSAPASASFEEAETILAQSRNRDGMTFVRRLCAEEFAGRKAGTPGADRAALWLATKFRQMGLEPLPEAPDFLHRFTMPVSLIASRMDRRARLVRREARPDRTPSGPARQKLDRSTTLIEYPAYRGGGFSVEAEAVFAGWGIRRRDLGWDDYQGADVRGKYVVYWEGAPNPGLARQPHARWRDASENGALGCLVLSRRPNAGPAGLENPVRDFPVLRLDPATARRVLRRPPPPPGSRSGQVLAPVRIDIPPAEDPARPVANVIGMIPGADPEVAGELVVLSAHYDHLGATGSVKSEAPGYFPGADDDASGVATVLGAARALRAVGSRPRRTILFCLWTGEEFGLAGSRAYVEQPLLPLEQMRFLLQVEMVGAGQTHSFETSPAHHAGASYSALQAATARLGLTLAGDGCRGASDHLPFIRRGVPALVLTTSGEHPDYHTPRDTPDRLQPAGIQNATRLCALTVWREANRSD